MCVFVVGCPNYASGRWRLDSVQVVLVGGHCLGEIDVLVAALDQAVSDRPLREPLLVGSGHELADVVLELLDVAFEAGDFGHSVGLPPMAGIGFAL